METPTKIKRIQTLTEDVKSFILEKPKNYMFKAGQFTTLSINQSGLEKKKRPISFASSEKANYLEFVIKKYPKDDKTSITSEMHKLKQGDELFLGSALGRLNYKGPGIFIAGGIGLMPFISIFRTISSDEVKKNKLIISFRTENDILFKDEIKELFKNSAKNVRITLTRQKKTGYDYGRINLDFIKKIAKNNNRFFYICGSGEFVRDVKQNLFEWGVSAGNIVTEGR